MKTITKIVISTLLAAAIVFGVTPKSYAFQLKNDENATIGGNETINTTLYISGKSITVNGTINGDLFCAGQTITVNGTINGDVICAGQTITVNGTVAGDMRVAGQYITVKGTVQRNSTVFGQGLYITKDATLNGDLLTAAQTVSQEGKINGELYGSTQELSLAGTVNKDVNVEVEKLTVTNDATLSGKLIYTSTNKADIANNSAIQGGISQKAPEVSQKEREQAPLREGWFLAKLSSVLSFALTTLLTVLLFPLFTKKVTALMTKSPGMTIGWGALALFVTPIAVIFLLFTIIGLPVAFVLALIWIAALIISRAYTGMIVGEYILSKYFPTVQRTPLIIALVGTVICSLVFFIPVVGGLLSFIAILWGLGGLVLSIREEGQSHLPQTA